MADVAGAHFLKERRNGEKRIDFPIDEVIHGMVGKGPTDIPRGIEFDQAGHYTQQHLFPIEHTHVPTLQTRYRCGCLLCRSSRSTRYASRSTT